MVNIPNTGRSFRFREILESTVEYVRGDDRPGTHQVPKVEIRLRKGLDRLSVIRCDMLLGMQITIVGIGGRVGAKNGFEAPVREYLERCSGFARCQSEGFKTEEKLLLWVGRQQGRTAAQLVLLDSRGTKDDFGGFCWMVGGASR